MKKIIFISFGLFFSISSFSQQKNIAGNWFGTLDAGGVPLKLVFHFTKNADQNYTGTLDSPDQGVKGIKCSAIIIAGDSVTVDIKTIGGTYSSLLVNDTLMNGTWKQGPGELSLSVKKVNEVPITVKPQTPQPPFAYNTEEVEYDNSDKSVHFAGTFTSPKTSGKFPAAILISGSGQQDRDETIMGHKPFAIIADYLTKAGFAILRVDDRGVGSTTGELKNATSASFAKDVEAGIAFLKTRPEVDAKRIGMIGHSEGGLIAEMVGSRRKDIDFIIMLAGPGIKGSDLLAEQSEAVLMKQGVSAGAAKSYKNFYRQVILSAIQSTDTTVAYNKAWKNYLVWKQTSTKSQREEIGYTNDTTAKVNLHSLVNSLSIPWLKYFLLTDPAPLLQKISCKVLALNGDKDVQVLAGRNLAGIKSALQKSGSKNFMVKKMPGLNHLFQTCNTCAVEEYGQLEESFSPTALKVMADWLKQNVQQK